MPKRLTGLDAAFLHLETPTSHMHVGGVIVVDPAACPGGTLTRDEVAAFIERRLHLGPPFRRRLVTVPFRLDHPVWIEDPDFDLDFHVRRGALPSPGGVDELAQFAADVMSRSMDRAHPLWELYVVEGLEDGRVALVSKTHHAAIDGVSGAELSAAMFQLQPDQEAPEPEHDWTPEREPGDLRLLASSGARLATLPLELVRTGRQAFGSLTGLVKLGREQRRDPPPAPFAAPTAPWNGSIGSHRRVALTQLSLTTVKAVKNALEGTVNDTLLATVAGALRTFLEQRGEPVDRPLVAMVPISVRSEETSGAIGNHVSAMLVGLPIDEPDPLERFARLRSGTAGAKDQHGALGATTIQQLAELAPGSVFALAARLYTSTRAADRHRPIWNTIVSNVPGPPIPLFCAGARVEAIYPLGPVHEMNGLNITLFSYEKTIYVGLNGDRDLMPDIDAVGEAMRASLDELAEAAGVEA